MHIHGVFAVALTLGCTFSAEAADYELGKSAASYCKYKLIPRARYEYTCLSRIMLYNRENGDMYLCSGEGYFWAHPDNTFDHEVSRNGSCTKLPSLDTPQRVDSKSEIIPPIYLGDPSFKDIPVYPYWYADTQGHVGVCIWAGVTMPTSPYPQSYMGSKFCVQTPFR
jgi:hypothetical protein